MPSTLSAAAARVKALISRRGGVAAIPGDEQRQRWNEWLWDIAWIVLTLLVLCESRVIAAVAAIRTAARGRSRRRPPEPTS